MKTVAVTAEFNPFHNGHRYLLTQIRKKYGKDCAVVAVMSGCYVQRGDVAIADPYFRAKTALLGGYDLILELPFPFSVSGAETFSRASVGLISSLGCVDAVAFGSECGDPNALRSCAKLLSDPKTADRIRLLRETEDGKKRGTPDLLRKIIQTTHPTEFGTGVGPNDLLAIGYLRALGTLGSAIDVFAVKRVGGKYESSIIDDEKYVGATALRALLNDQKFNEFDSYIPAECRPLWKEAIETHSAPASFSPRLSAAVLAALIATDPTSISNRIGVDGGLSSRILDAAKDAVSLDDLIARTSCRSYSDSEIRRAVLSLWLGFTSPGADDRPLYTRVFGFSDRGRELLATIKRTSSLPILTKTADWVALPYDARKQAEFSLSADRFFGLALPSPRPASDAYRGSPCHITGERD